MPKVSVIIPAYNAERFILECFDSLSSQTLSDFEVIVCDDGSADGTVSVVEGYCARDSRFQLIRLNHVSAGSARNAGLDNATGEYLYFLDADDLIAHNALERLCSAADECEADVVSAKSHYFDDVTRKTSPIEFSVTGVEFDCALTGENLPERPFQSFVGWPWDKLFRAEFVKRHSLRFQNLRSSNDALFVFMALCKASCITCLSDDLFAHRTNNGGSLEHTRSKSWGNAISAMEAIGNELRADDACQRYWQSYANWVSHFSYWSMSSLDSGSLSVDVVEAFDSFVKTTLLNKDEYYCAEDASFALLSASSRIETVLAYIRLRSASEAQTSRLYREEHELTARIDELTNKLTEERDRLQNEIAGLDGKIEALYNSRTYRLGNTLATPLRMVKKLLTRI